ncbi:GIY-YIG nuclease family protein [Bifidobacterium breve]|uniref:GIY-YIG nuclease family protein n=1 Tax=Bifidobacterium breve TaxID=1685 RepID=UPI00254B4318|nr:GIY-YIG nuclease family protein [Bifidobacterium breve]MDK8732564.1 GIY-YIG nuclease family protein [Bifidobacterium breve]
MEIRRRKAIARAHAIVEHSRTLSPTDFLEERNQYKGHLKDFDFPGFYLIHNKTRDKYYVGRADHVPERVNINLQGRGNMDISAHIRCGDDFEISLIPLESINQSDLARFERTLIDAYNAYRHGYNINRGRG